MGAGGLEYLLTVPQDGKSLINSGGNHLLYVCDLQKKQVIDIGNKITHLIPF